MVKSNLRNVLKIEKQIGIIALKGWPPLICAYIRITISKQLVIASGLKSKMVSAGTDLCIYSTFILKQVIKKHRDITLLSFKMTYLIEGYCRYWNNEGSYNS